jgi:Ca2+-binding EF-hand superfamily protein
MNMLAAFKIIDEDRTGFIDLDAIYLFLKRNKIHISESEIMALFRRADQDGDGRLSFSEFSDALTPDDPSYKVSMKSSSILTRDRISTPMRHSTYFSASKKRLDNLDYQDYLSASARKHSLSKSRHLSGSPSRKSITKRLHESHMDIRDLEASKMSQSMYHTPSKSRASRHSSPIKEHKSPIREVEDHELAKALKEQIDLDRELETLKNDLALRNDFNILDAFRFFDIDARGYITKNELKDGFNEFDIFPTSNELYLIMRKFDTDNDGLLRFPEFSEIFNPKQGEYSNILNDRKPSYLDSSKLNLIFSYETRRGIKGVMEMTLSNEILSEDLRQKIARRPFFNIYEAFKTLDKNDKGYIDVSEFRELLVDHGVYASSKELMNLIQRYDKNQDGKVSYYDFVQELTPKSPTKY